MHLTKGEIKAALEAGELDRLVVRQQPRYSPADYAIIQAVKAQRVRVKKLVGVAFDQEFGRDHDVVGMKRLVQHVEFSELIANPETYSAVLMCDHVQDPHNFGAIIRTADAFGIQAIIYPKDRQCPITDTVVQTSTGASERMRFCQVTNLVSCIKQLKEATYWVYGTDVMYGTALHQWKLHDPSVLIVSHEHKGLSAGLRKVVDDVVHIPMEGKTASLNVSVATGILACHMSFQRQYR